MSRRTSSRRRSKSQQSKCRIVLVVLVDPAIEFGIRAGRSTEYRDSSQVSAADSKRLRHSATISASRRLKYVAASLLNRDQRNALVATLLLRSPFT